jgi:hypothetical protein
VEKRVDTGTVGWAPLASATLGITRAQSLRLCAVNLGPKPCRVTYGLWANPHATLLTDAVFELEPGESRCIDLVGDELPADLFDKRGRAQIRGLVRHGGDAVCANLEIFDSDTGATSVALPLHEPPSRTR